MRPAGRPARAGRLARAGADVNGRAARAWAGAAQVLHLAGDPREGAAAARHEGAAGAGAGPARPWPGALGRAHQLSESLSESILV